MKKGIEVCGRKTILEIVMGEEKLAKFRKLFGKVFTIEGPKNTRVPEKVEKKSDGFHVTVILISEKEEEEFRNFLIALNEG